MVEAWAHMFVNLCVEEREEEDERGRRIARERGRERRRDGERGRERRRKGKK